MGVVVAQVQNLPNHLNHQSKNKFGKFRKMYYICFMIKVRQHTWNCPTCPFGLGESCAMCIKD